MKHPATVTFRCLLWLIFMAAVGAAHADGGPGYALNFSGAGDYVYVAPDPALNTYPLTVTAWFKTTQSGSQNGLVSKSQFNSANGWQVFLYLGAIEAVYSTPSGSVGNSASPLNGGNVANNFWHQVAFTVDASGGRLYVDGVLMDSRGWTGTAGPVSNSDEMRLGSFAGGGGFYNGALDEVTVWNVALSQTQIQTNMNRSLTGNETGLLVYYRCDENAPGNLEDSAPLDGNNFGAINSASFVPSGVQPFSPDVVTSPASSVTTTTVTLNGLANPAGTNTSAWFEWGATTNYGKVTPSQPMGNGASYVNFSQSITSLVSGITYHYRARASNSLGLAYGTNQSFVPGDYPGNIDLITGTETWPHVTQDESAIWGHSNTVVVAYTDSRGANLSPQSYGGVSVSTNGGAAFTRLSYFFNEAGACYGQAGVLFSVRASKWYISFLSARCGAQGIGRWESPDGLTWSNSGCIATGTNLDRPSIWVDNNPGSPYYGRQYAAFNDFALGNAPVRLAYSTNDGITWSAPVSLYAASYHRALKVTGSLGTDGTIFVQTLDEGVGGLDGSRRNYIYRSTDGGDSWTQIQQNVASFYGPGRSASGYFAGMYPTPVAGYWLEMGWGQPGVGPDGVVHYAYSARPFSTTSEPGNIYYIRSTNNGTTWSAPLQLNTDSSRAQWSPSLSVNARGVVFVSWYDERHTPLLDSLERFGRASLDNGVTWGADAAISDVIFPKPLQPDPAIRTTYAGTYNFAAFSNDGYGDEAYHAWTDGRVSISNSPQQDIFFARKSFNTTLRIDSLIQGEGQIVLHGIGMPNLVHTIQVSTNLAANSFITLGSVTPNFVGQWQYNAGPANPSRRFYRLAYP